MSVKDSITVHIDYSSMPRSWYCKLPILLQSIIRKIDKVYYWYTEGEYPSTYEEYPSAGIDAFSFFSGKPSLKIGNNRMHILALGYDTIRTQAIDTRNRSERKRFAQAKRDDGYTINDIALLLHSSATTTKKYFTISKGKIPKDHIIARDVQHQDYMEQNKRQLMRLENCILTDMQSMQSPELPGIQE